MKQKQFGGGGRQVGGKPEVDLMKSPAELRADLRKILDQKRSAIGGQYDAFAAFMDKVTIRPAEKTVFLPGAGNKGVDELQSIHAGQLKDWLDKSQGGPFQIENPPVGVLEGTDDDSASLKLKIAYASQYQPVK